MRLFFCASQVPGGSFARRFALPIPCTRGKAPTRVITPCMGPLGYSEKHFVHVKWMGSLVVSCIAERESDE
jgi:hypothetical protein